MCYHYGGRARRPSHSCDTKEVGSLYFFSFYAMCLSHFTLNITSTVYVAIANGADELDDPMEEGNFPWPRR